MSADNWAVCPQCESKAKAEAQAKRAEVMASYGAVSVDEFDTARAALVDEHAENFAEQFRTFRENYEIYGAETGEIMVHYSGGCGVCSLSCKFDTARKFFHPETGPCPAT